MKKKKTTAESAVKEDTFAPANPDSGRAEPWIPTYRWFATAGSIILIFLIVFFFTANAILKPWMRQRPLEVTPWLAKGEDAEKVKEAKSPVFPENKDIDNGN